LAEVPDDVIAADESYFRVEMVTHEQAFHLDAVAIPGVIQLHPIARVVAREIGRAGPRRVGTDRQVVVEGERAVDSVGVVSPAPARANRSPGVQQPDAAAAQDIALDPDNLQDTSCEMHASATT